MENGMNLRYINYQKFRSAVKLFGILIDSDLTFNDYLKIICKKASQKLTAISRFCHILSENKRIILLKTFLNFNSTTAIDFDVWQ